MAKRILITGGAGYCGSILVPRLLSRGYTVTVLDTFWFGNHLQDHENLRLVQGDIRDVSLLKKIIPGHEMVLHLACIANDASFELDERLSTTVNYESFGPLVEISKNSGVKRFVYASSSSVYGISSEKDVTEEHPLIPLTLYNKFKGLCEPVLLNNIDQDFEGVIFRPATVCGYSPRQRLDLTVNILTHLAIKKQKITVFGGEQLRPNLHIEDYARVCELLLEASPNLVNGEIFNVGIENLEIMEIAKLVRDMISRLMPQLGDISIDRTQSADNRSYHINSDKIARILGFRPQKSVSDAVKELSDAFCSDKFPDSLDDKYYNVKTMMKLKIT